VQLPDTCELQWQVNDQAGLLCERVVSFGAQHSLFGVVTAPASMGGIAGTAPVLLLLNSGAVHHVGPNRLYVQIARRLALSGFRVLRFDLPGLGDSPASADAAENLPYSQSAVSAVNAAVDFACHGLCAGEVHAAGICSGAYHCLKAAVAGVRLNSIVVINPLTFFWKPGMSLAAPAHQDTEKIMRYRSTGLNAESLRLLVTRWRDLGKLAPILGRHMLRNAHGAARRIGRSCGVRLRDDLVVELRQVQRQGMTMHFVFSATDPGHHLLRQQAGTELTRLLKTRAMTVDFIDNADHTFTPHAAQQALVNLVDKLVGSRGEMPGGG
jgi:pimeloyl-ACP methyl ester carboxylesterase